MGHSIVLKAKMLTPLKQKVFRRFLVLVTQATKVINIMLVWMLQVIITYDFLFQKVIFKGSVENTYFSHKPS